MKRLNSRPSLSQGKRNESKRSQNDESNHTREGGKEEREEHKHDSQEQLTNQILEDTRRLGPPFPLQSLVLTQILQFVDLSHNKT